MSEYQMEAGEFHQAGGWRFKRLEDGSVRVRRSHPNISGQGHVDHIIPAAEWISVLTAVSIWPGSSISERLATKLHVDPNL